MLELNFVDVHRDIFLLGSVRVTFSRHQVVWHAPMHGHHIVIDQGHETQSIPGTCV